MFARLGGWCVRRRGVVVIAWLVVLIAGGAISGVVGSNFRSEFDLPDVLELLRAQPSLSRTTMDAARNAALEGLDTGAMNA